jgi:hypothetical protein
MPSRSGTYTLQIDPAQIEPAQAEAAQTDQRESPFKR